MANCYSCVVKVVGPKKAEVLEHLRHCLLESQHSQYAEVWVDHGDFPCLCALVNGDRGWLMCLRYEGDAGFSSRNPSYAGPQNAQLDFRLSNGQRDCYPMSWTLSSIEVHEALTFFAANRMVPHWIAWSNDSCDGNDSPNDDFEPA